MLTELSVSACRLGPLAGLNRDSEGRFYACLKLLWNPSVRSARFGCVSNSPIARSGGLSQPLKSSTLPPLINMQDQAANQTLVVCEGERARSREGGRGKESAQIQSVLCASENNLSWLIYAYRSWSNTIQNFHILSINTCTLPDSQAYWASHPILYFFW